MMQVIEKSSLYLLQNNIVIVIYRNPYKTSILQPIMNKMSEVKKFVSLNISKIFYCSQNIAMQCS